MDKKNKVRRKRERLGLTQKQFWSRVGITQSGGCRYESGRRDAPLPVRLLLSIAYDAAPAAAKTISKLRSAPHER